MRTQIASRIASENLCTLSIAQSQVSIRLSRGRWPAAKYPDTQARNDQRTERRAFHEPLPFFI